MSFTKKIIIILFILLLVFGLFSDLTASVSPDTKTTYRVKIFSGG